MYNNVISFSTVSSGVNALALVFMTDIFKPLYRKITQHDLNEIRATIYSKIIALVYGLLTIALAFLSQYFGSLILQIAISIFGMVGGPLLSLFVLALFFPCVNSLVGSYTPNCILNVFHIYVILIFFIINIHIQTHIALEVYILVNTIVQTVSVAI